MSGLKIIVTIPGFAQTNWHQKAEDLRAEIMEVAGERMPENIFLDVFEKIKDSVGKLDVLIIDDIRIYPFLVNQDIPTYAAMPNARSFKGTIGHMWMEGVDESVIHEYIRTWKELFPVSRGAYGDAVAVSYLDPEENLSFSNAMQFFDTVHSTYDGV